MFANTHRSLNELWASLLLEELARRGVQHCCLAPGSRSAPLVMAASRRADLQLHHHFDERGLGFLALGMAKGSRQPVAIITTSGTAVANLYPAVIEATLSGAQLVILSADRPPELHNCGANQAIDQPGLFAQYPKRSLYLLPPQLDHSARSLLTDIAGGMQHIQQSGGVFHINCMFDEPLYPDEDATDASEWIDTLGTWRTNNAPWPLPPPIPEANPVAPEQWQRFSSQPGIIVAGRLDNTADARAVLALSTSLGWPLLADIQSQLRGETVSIHCADLLLCQPSAQRLLIEHTRLLQFGSHLVSKRLQELVDSDHWQDFWLVHENSSPLAPGRNQSAFFSSNIALWCQQREIHHPPVRQSTERLKQLDREMLTKLDTYFSSSIDNARQLSEPVVARQICNLLPQRHQLFAGNSLSIRLLDQFCGQLPDGIHVLSNRGASGIDGLVATAVGCTLVNDTSTTLLLGDTSLLYDLNSLALLRRHTLPLVIVVLNNNGGGIFNLLPIPDPDIRRQHFQCPHDLRFEQACAMFAIDYHAPENLGEFTACYQSAISTSTPCLIEITCDGAETARIIQHLSTTNLLTESTARA